jgi:hypothetical protein
VIVPWYLRAGGLALIEPTKAINLHGARAATERQGDADLIGGEISLAFMRLRYNTIDETVISVDFWEHGDQADFWDSYESGTLPALGDIEIERDGEPLYSEEEVINEYGGLFRTNNPQVQRCASVAAPNGTTQFGTGDATTTWPALDLPVDGQVYDVILRNHASGKVIRSWPGLEFICESFVQVNRRSYWARAAE